MLTHALTTLTERLNTEGLANIIISDPASIRYFLNYDNFPYERLMALVMHDDGTGELYLNRLFPTPHLEPGLAEQITVIYHRDGEDAISVLAGHLKPGHTAIDKVWPSHFLIDLIAKAPAMTPVNASIVDDIRAIKTPDEQTIMKESSRLNDQAMEKMIDLVAQGLSEREMREALAQIYQELGTDGFSFEPIIAYGPNGSDPHHTTDDSFADYGDTVVIDMGAMYKGYASDMTRTVFYSQPSDEALKVYDIVKRANEAAIRRVKPGVPFSDIDRAARDIIEEAGYGKFFTHRTGHFIGQECHEAGDVSEFNHTPCEVGQIFSIEPGIYLPGHLGVRIEDLVLVTEDGCDILNSVTKEPIIVTPVDSVRS